MSGCRAWVVLSEVPTEGFSRLPLASRSGPSSAFVRSCQSIPIALIHDARGPRHWFLRLRRDLYSLHRLRRSSGQRRADAQGVRIVPSSLG